ncbi:putative hemagglutinin/hemolysin-related protein [Bdellovibrio bacteriovorus W]|nr:putative hemagglutinin/hemolysin-related protein [Bdellovibrio bacteriovorus W]
MIFLGTLHLLSLLFISLFLTACGGLNANLSSLLNKSPQITQSPDINASGYSNSTQQRFTLKPSSDAVAYEYRLNQSAWIEFTPTSNSELVLQGLNEGEQTLHLRYRYASGELSPLTSIQWKIDLTPPLVTILTDDHFAQNTNQLAFAFSGIDSGPISTPIEKLIFECDLQNSGAWKSCRNGHEFSQLPEGNIVLSVRAKDLAGNISPVESIEGLVDTVSPRLTISFIPSIRGGGTANIKLNLTEKNIPDSAQVKTFLFMNGIWSPLSTHSVSKGNHNNTAINFTSPAFPLEDQTGLKIRAEIEDLAGNIGTAESNAFAVEITAPVIRTEDFILADGALTTYFRNINARLSVYQNVGAVSHIWISESSSFSEGAWQAYTTQNIAFQLSGLGGPKKVYVKVKTLSNLESNVVSKDIDYIPEDIPTSTWLGPTIDTTLQPNTPVSLSWKCENSTHATPTKEIAYSVDDGVYYHTIATQLPVDGSYEGRFTWNVPSISPFGVLITETTPIKFAAYCQSTSGIVSSVESNLYNSEWTIFAGGGVNLQNIHMSVATLDRVSTHADSKNNLYYSKNGNAIFKVDYQTGLIKSIYGNASISGCGDKELLGATILEVDRKHDKAYIMSGEGLVCPRLVILDLNTLETKLIPIPYRNVTDVHENQTLVNFKKLIFFRDYAYYWMDLQNPNAPPVKIIGKNNTCGTLSSEGDDADLSYLPCENNPAADGYTLLVSRDEKKIWILARSTKNMRLEGDFQNGFKISKENPFPIATSFNFNRCVKDESDIEDRLWICREKIQVGRGISTFNEVTEELKTFLVPTYKNNNSIRVYVGGSSQGAIVTTSQNELLKFTHSNGVPTFTTISSNPLFTAGNGNDLSRVAFTDVDDLLWHEASKSLFVRGISHLRILKSTATYEFNDIFTAVNLTIIANSIPSAGLAVSPDNQELAFIRYSGDSRPVDALSLLSINKAMESIDPIHPTNYSYLKFSGKPDFPTSLAPLTLADSTLYSLYSSRHLLAYGGDGLLYSIIGRAPNQEQDITLVKMNKVNIEFVSGKLGVPELVPETHGVAFGTSLWNVFGMQTLSDGNILLIDGLKLRKFNILSAPVTFDVLADYESLGNRPPHITNWSHAKHDEATGWTYYSVAEKESTTGLSEIWAVHPHSGWKKISDNRLSIGRDSKTNPRIADLRLEITPFGVLVLDNANRRILIRKALPTPP